MKRLYLDCEFDGFGGPLISMALVAPPRGTDDDCDYCDYAYMAIPDLSRVMDPWVLTNVLPVISFTPQDQLIFGRHSLGDTIEPEWLAPDGFARRVHDFLGKGLERHGDWVEVVADHPADLKHLHAVLDRWSSLNGFIDMDFQLRTLVVHSGKLESLVPHNALQDALALARWGEKELGA